MGALSHGRKLIRSLVVDDEEAIGTIIKELISGDNVSVELFEDSRRAVEFLQKNPVDIVITDLMMNHIDGLGVLRCAKETNPAAVVIIITGHATLETAIEAVREGAYDYIKKPFKLREMELAFDKAVEKVRLVQNNKELFEELNDIRAKLAEATAENLKLRYPDQEDTKAETPLHFFSPTSLNLELLGKAGTVKDELYRKLEKIAELKKEGLLTETEFNTVKDHIIKSLKHYKI